MNNRAKIWDLARSAEQDTFARCDTSIETPLPGPPLSTAVAEPAKQLSLMISERNQDRCDTCKTDNSTITGGFLGEERHLLGRRIEAAERWCHGHLIDVRWDEQLSEWVSLSELGMAALGLLGRLKRRYRLRERLAAGHLWLDQEMAAIVEQNPRDLEYVTRVSGWVAALEAWERLWDEKVAWDQAAQAMNDDV